MKEVFFGLFTSVFLLLFIHRIRDDGNFWFSGLSNSKAANFKDRLHEVANHRKIAETASNLTVSVNKASNENNLSVKNPVYCSGLVKHSPYKNECEYLKSNSDCSSGGFFDYIRFFYCDFGNFRFLGYLALSIWLAALFYMLGNTAADFFCCSLEKLSSILKLPPTVAGVTLLPLGNGAPDVFASIAAFVGKDAGDVGFNSVLGGAVFVTCIVVGAVSLCVAKKEVHIDKRCFVRDIIFFLFTLLSLLLIFVIGRASVGAAIAFISIFIVYACLVGANEILRKHAVRLKLNAIKPLVPVQGSLPSQENNEENEAMSRHLLCTESSYDVPQLPPSLPSWMWASHVAIYSNHPSKLGNYEEERSPWGWIDEESDAKKGLSPCRRLLSLMEIPLMMPRRLTIPLIEEDSWSKPCAVASVAMAPILLAFLLNTEDDVGHQRRMILYTAGVVMGCLFAILACRYTAWDHPPQRFALVWVLGGFTMSIVWFYIIANELVALLVAFGVILKINPTILGLTVLAWGNSMGDFLSNVTLAMNGSDSLQIAFSGCYAGPMFNTIIGLGISILLGASSESTGVYIIPHDPGLFYTVGFLVAGLLWALVVLPRNNMQPTKHLGAGLIIIYIVFLFVRVTVVTGGLMG